MVSCEDMLNHYSPISNSCLITLTITYHGMGNILKVKELLPLSQITSQAHSKFFVSFEFFDQPGVAVILVVFDATYLVRLNIPLDALGAVTFVKHLLVGFEHGSRLSWTLGYPGKPPKERRRDRVVSNLDTLSTRHFYRQCAT